MSEIKQVSRECGGSRSGQHTWVHVRTEKNDRDELVFCDYCDAKRK